MTIEIKSDDLLSTLQKVEPAIDDNRMLPIFGCYCFTGKEVYAYNGIVGISTPCDIDLNVGVASHIASILKTMPSCTLKLTPGDGDLKIKAPRTSFKVPVSDSNQYVFTPPSSSKPKPQGKITLDSELTEAIKTALSTFEENMTVPVQRGVHVVVAKGKLIVYSTDNETVTRYYVRKEQADDVKLTLSKSFCSSLIALAPTEGDGEIRHDKKSAWCLFDSGTSVQGNLAEKTDVSQISDLFKGFPKQGLVEITDGFRQACQRASLLAKVGKAETIMLSATQNGKLAISTKTGGHGELFDSVNMKAPKYEVSVTPALLERAVTLSSSIAFNDQCLYFKSQGKLQHILSVVGS